MINLPFPYFTAVRCNIFECWIGCVITFELMHSLYRALKDFRNMHLITAITFGN